MTDQRDTYELFPAGYLDKGCVAYLFGAVREVIGDLTQERPDGSCKLKDPYWYVPCRRLDGTEVQAPPIDRGQLVPVRTDGQGHKRPVVPMVVSHPLPGVQDNRLIGLDIEDLLHRLRIYVGRREQVPAELASLLDSWMTHGYPLPAPWRHGQARHLLGFVITARREVGGLAATLARVEEDIRAMEKTEGQG